MRGMNVEAYRQLANMKDIVSLLGPRMLIEEIGEAAVIRTIGRERIRELLEQMDREPEASPSTSDSECPPVAGVVGEFVGTDPCPNTGSGPRPYRRDYSLPGLRP